MELIELKAKLIESFTGEAEDLKEILDKVENDVSVYPFNEFEALSFQLLEQKGLSFDKYNEIRQDYIHANPNLWIFEISAPRGFGEKFAQTYVHGLCPELQKPSKKLDATYNGEYDFWLDGIKVEVKASRAVDKDSKEPLYMKALSSNTTKPFLMNFQQLKPMYCDVFIWVAVFRDKIKLWVLGSKDVIEHPLYSKGQHRGNKGNEGQLHLKDDNISQLKTFELVEGQSLCDLVREAARKSFRAD